MTHLLCPSFHVQDFRRLFFMHLSIQTLHSSSYTVHTYSDMRDTSPSQMLTFKYKSRVHCRFAQRFQCTRVQSTMDAL